MEIFEIHITGTGPEIIEKFKKLQIKTLEVELLDPKQNVVGKEYMCSHIIHTKDFNECKTYVSKLIENLDGVEIVRSKIETPYQLKYVKDSIYAECHFPTTDLNIPTVRNVGSNKLVSTERTYNKDEYSSLKAKYATIKSEFELCLYDSNTNFDDFWLSHYK